MNDVQGRSWGGRHSHGGHNPPALLPGHPCWLNSTHLGPWDFGSCCRKDDTERPTGLLPGSNGKVGTKPDPRSQAGSSAAPHCSCLGAGHITRQLVCWRTEATGLGRKKEPSRKEKEIRFSKGKKSLAGQPAKTKMHKALLFELQAVLLPYVTQRPVGSGLRGADPLLQHP